MTCATGRLRPSCAAIRSSTPALARTLPRPTTTTWSAMSSSSLSRWLETSTARPSPRGRAEPAHPDDALGVHAVERLVQISTGGSPSIAAAIPSRWRIPNEKPPALRRRARGRPVLSPRRPCWRSAAGMRAIHSRWLRRCGSAEARRRRPARRHGASDGADSVGVPADQRGALLERVEPEDHSHRRRLAGAVGPTNPVTVPGATVKGIPSRARVLPNRLRSPLPRSSVRSLASILRGQESLIVVRPSCRSSVAVADTGLRPTTRHD